VAAQWGHVRSQYVLGALHFTGLAGAEQDYFEAASWFSKAAVRGLKEAQWELGEIFRRGLFCDVDPSLARKYIKMAKKQGGVIVVQ
jgi:TPR repeat protein